MRPLQEILCVFIKEDNDTTTMKVFHNPQLASLYYSKHPEEEARVFEYQKIQTERVHMITSVVFEDVSPFGDNEWETK